MTFRPRVIKPSASKGGPPTRRPAAQQSNLAAALSAGRTPPHDPDAEAAVLGAILLDGSAIEQVAGWLAPEDFYREGNGFVYQAALTLRSLGTAIDPVSTAARLEQAGVLDRVGGRAGLAELAFKVESPALIEHHARIVREKSLKRRLIVAGTLAAEAGYDPAVTSKDAVQKLLPAVHALAAVPDEPSVVRDGLAYRGQFPAAGVVLSLTRVREARGYIMGELAVTVPAGELPLSVGEFTVSLPNSRTGLAERLAARPEGAYVDWVGILEVFCQEVMRLHRAGEGWAEIGADLLPEPVYLLEPLLTAGEPTILYGPGGTGKSTLAAAVAVSVRSGIEIVPGWRPLSAPVYVLDWESGPERWANRLYAVAAGAGVEPVQVDYLRMARPLADDLERVRAKIEEHGPGLAIVDSMVMASGGRGDGEGAEASAVRLFAAFRELGCAVLGIDHVTKVDSTSEAPTAGPYGSVFKTNLARSVFELKAERDQRGERTEVALVDKKPNYRVRLETTELVILREDDGARIRFARTEVDAPELLATLSVRERTRRLLRRGRKSDEELAEELGKSIKYVREVVRRHPDDFVRWQDGLIALKCAGT